MRTRKGLSSTARPSKTFSVQHQEPRGSWLGYILLPYGDFYKPTKEIARAKQGDVIRFYHGGEYRIERVMKIPQDDVCDMLCRVMYGIPWSLALKKWQSYAVIDGNDKDVISSDYCLWVIYDYERIPDKGEILGEGADT